MAAGHDEEGWNRLGRDVMVAPGRRNGMARLRMQAWSEGRGGVSEKHRKILETNKKKRVFGENAEECARDSWLLIFLPLR